MEALGFALRAEAVLATFTEEVIGSSEIEGEILDREQVRSSIAWRLGLDVGGSRPADRHVEGNVEMMLDATQNCAGPLTDERVFAWHASLSPTRRSGMSGISVGAWRDDRAGPIQIVSGPVGRERVHYEAPAAKRLRKEMAAFLKWFNADAALDPVLKAALAHLWFVTIHPFDDGNGRIARAIAEMALARADESPQRFSSMSAQIRSERSAYYEVLEATQKGDLDVSAWLEWFLACLERAIESADGVLASVLRKARSWEAIRQEPLISRQRSLINRLLDGFEGKLTSSKWARICKCSPDTALRDINDLIGRGILQRDPAGGCSTSYPLVERDHRSSATAGATSMRHLP
jgi:Fic family protein